MNSNFFNRFFDNGNNQPKAKRQRGRSLQIERLEEREMLSISPLQFPSSNDNETIQVPAGEVVAISNRNESVSSASDSAGNEENTAMFASTVLNAPINLRAVATSQTTLAIQWNTVSGATEYVLQRKGLADLDFQTIYTGADAKFIDQGLAPGTEYQYRVQVASSTFSGIVSMSTAVSHVNGNPATDSPIILSTIAQDGKVTITWTDLGSDYTYTVMRAGSIVASSYTSNSYTDDDPLGIGEYAVRAFSRVTQRSSTVCTTIAWNTVKPVEFTGYEATENGGIKLLWDAQPEMTYQIMRLGRILASNLKTGEWTDTDPLDDNPYVIVATYQEFDADLGRIVTRRTYSNVFSVKKPEPSSETKLTTPTLGDVLSTGSDAISVAWQAVANADGYVVQYATDSNFTANVGTIDASGTSTTITGLTANTTYHVRVLATGSGTYSNSDYSTAKSATTDTIKLAAPTLGDVTISGSGEITVTWSGVANADGYTIQYATDSTFTAVAGSVTAGSSATSTTLTGVNTDMLLYVRVLATGAGAYGDSDPSTVKLATIPLEYDVSTAGSLNGTGSSTVYKLEVTVTEPLSVVLSGYGQGSNVRVYAKFGSPPTRADYAYISEGGDASKQSITIPSTVPGTLYIMVVGNDVPTPTGYTILATSETLIVDSVSLIRLGENEPFTVAVEGAGFNTTTELTLIASDGTRYTAQSTTLNSSTSINAIFAGTVPPGTYKLEAKNDTGTPVVVDNAVTIEDQVVDASFEAELILPSSLTGTDQGTLYIEYTNTGTVAMVAPLLTLIATVEGDEGARMTLDANRLAAGEWTSTVPAGFSTDIRVYADGAHSGILLPGETVLVPVYWAGWNTLLAEGEQIDFSLGIVYADSAVPLNLSALKTSLKPDDYTEDAWDVVWSRLQSLMGTTWGDYINMLHDIASSLDETGSKKDYTVEELFGVALQWACDDFNPMGGSFSYVDLAVAGPTSTLQFIRIYNGMKIPNRYIDGDLGFGWTHNWDWKLDIQTNGDAILQGPSGTGRLYQGDTRSLGDFVSQPGDTSTLRLFGSKYTLTDLDGTVTVFDSQGRLESITDTNGNVVTATHDADGRLSLIADAYGNSLTFTYNADGKIESVVDSNGKSATYEYDSENHLVKYTNTLNQSVEYGYDAGGGHMLEDITYDDGNSQYFAYNNHVLEVSYLSGQAVSGYQGGTTAKDFLKYEFWEFGSHTHTVWFNVDGRIAKMVDAQGRTAIYEYDYYGRVVKITDETGRFDAMTYDSNGNLVSIENANNEEVRYTYTASGGIASLTDARGNVMSFLYDANGNMTGIVRADGTASGWTYNNNGTVASTANRRGDTYTYTYDTITGDLLENRPSTAPNSIRYEYDAKGNVVKITDENDNVTEMTRDANGLLTRIDYPTDKWIEYTYDEYGRQTSTKSDDYHIRYTYNEFGLLESIIDVLDGDKVVTHYEYDLLGRLVKETQGNGTYTTYDYDPQVGSVLVKTDYDQYDAVLSRFEYVYDANGLINSMTTLDGQWTYGYDAVGQLVAASFVSSGGDLVDRNYVYVYDAAGNRIETIEDGVTIEYVVNEMNQYTKVGDFEYKYDADGNMIEKKNTVTGETWTFEWCQGNWMRASTRFDADGNVAETWEYEYDVFGNRIAVVHDGQRTEYLVDPKGDGTVLAEYDGAGNLTAGYIHGSYGLTSRFDTNGTVYYGYDLLGSTSIITDDLGDIVNRYAYDPFGQALLTMENGIVDNPFQYGGQHGIMTDRHADLIDVRARWYDPATGRFTSEDPAGLHGGDTNLYRYCLNDAVSQIDVSGQFFSALKKAWNKVSAVVTTTISTVLDVVVDKIPFVGTIVDTVFTGISFVTNYLTENISYALCNFGFDLIDITAGVVTGMAISAATMGTATAGGIAAGFAVSLVVDKATDIAADYLCEAYKKKLADTPDPKAALEEILVERRAMVSGSAEQFSGPSGWIRANQTVGHRVTFANEATAQASVRKVEINIPIDAGNAALDWSTFAISAFGFGKTVVTAANVPSYAFKGNSGGTTLVGEEVAGASFIQLNFDYHLDLDNGNLRIIIESYHLGIDLTGFLNPGQAGFVEYTVKTKADAQTGDTIQSSASIRFDETDTPTLTTTVATIDHTGPTTGGISITPITDTTFNVDWSGASDMGSGISHYDVYIGSDLWLGSPTTKAGNATNADFVGVAGHSYFFTVWVWDKVGYGSAAAYASITLAPVAPETFTTPNITSNSISLAWNEPFGSTSYDVQYREVGSNDWIDAPSVAVPSMTFSDLNAFSHYEFRVRAGNSAGVSEWSQTVQVPTKEAPSLLVTTLDDVIDDFDGVTSLREAITYSLSVTDKNVGFDPSLTGGTMTLVHGEISIVDTLILDASGLNITIDANNLSRVFHIGDVDASRYPTVTLAGLTITGGNGTCSHYIDVGPPEGNVYYTDGYGGGIYNSGHLTVIDCTITGNTATEGGGGISTWGGSASSYTANSDSSLTVVNSTISGNTVDNNNGGGIYIAAGPFTMTNSMVVDNVGIGIYLANTTLSSDNQLNHTITNSLIAKNSGGGIHCQYLDMAITNSTIVDNVGYGIYGSGGPSAGGGTYDSNTALNNSIVVNNTTDVYIRPGDSISGYGTLTGDNNLIGGDPLFVDPEQGDYRLAAGSAAINAGNNALITDPDALDLAGQTRILHDTVDIGAYEYSGTLPLAVTTLDDPVVIDSGSIEVSWAAVGKAVGYVVEYSTSNSFANSQSVELAGMSTTLIGLAANTTYFIRVTAVATGLYRNSDPSASKSVVTDKSTLTAPTLDAPIASGDTISIAWSAVTNASGYVIQYSTDAAFASDVVTLPGVNAATTSATISGLAVGTTYYIRIRTLGTGTYLDSSYSAAKSVMIVSSLFAADSLDAFWSEYGLNGIEDELFMTV